MKARIVLICALCAALVVFGVAFYEHGIQVPPTVVVQQTQMAQSQTQTQQSASGTSPASYTLLQVAEHNIANSCWSAINGNVYDLTRWIGQHPGGPDAILSVCGTDGSAAFNAQHEGNSQVEAILQQFYIGPLAQS